MVDFDLERFEDDLLSETVSDLDFFFDFLDLDFEIEEFILDDSSLSFEPEFDLDFLFFFLFDLLFDLDV